MVLIPPHWTEHDGQGCPVDERSCPAVMFRQRAYGMRTPLTIQMGVHQAGKWQSYAGRDCWNWLPGSDDGQDIVAFIGECGQGK